MLPPSTSRISLRDGLPGLPDVLENRDALRRDDLAVLFAEREGLVDEDGIVCQRYRCDPGDAAEDDEPNHRAFQTTRADGIANLPPKTQRVIPRRL